MKFIRIRNVPPKAPLVVAPPKPEVTVTMEGKRALPVLTANSSPEDIEFLRKRRNQLKPKMVCDSCALADSCPRYDPGSVCAYDDYFGSLPSRDINVVMEAMRTVASENTERLHRALHFEKFGSGGQINKEVTKLSQVVMEQLSDLVEMTRDVQKINISVSGQGDVPTPSIISQLFGGAPAEKPPQIEDNSIPLALPSEVQDIELLTTHSSSQTPKAPTEPKPE